MRFVDVNKVLGKARRTVSAVRYLSEEELSEPRRLGEILRNLFSKVSELEAKAQPEAMEFEITVSTGGATVTLDHNFNSPVRWWVTSWRNASGGHSLVKTTASDSNKLVLGSYVAGTAVVRVEPSQYGIT